MKNAMGWLFEDLPATTPKLKSNSTGRREIPANMGFQVVRTSARVAVSQATAPAPAVRVKTCGTCRESVKSSLPGYVYCGVARTTIDRARLVESESACWI